MEEIILTLNERGSDKNKKYLFLKCNERQRKKLVTIFGNTDTHHTNVSGLFGEYYLMYRHSRSISLLRNACCYEVFSLLFYAVSDDTEK